MMKSVIADKMIRLDFHVLQFWKDVFPSYFSIILSHSYVFLWLKVISIVITLGWC